MLLSFCQRGADKTRQAQPSGRVKFFFCFRRVAYANKFSIRVAYANKFSINPASPSLPRESAGRGNKRTRAENSVKNSRTRALTELNFSGYSPGCFSAPPITVMNITPNVTINQKARTNTGAISATTTKKSSLVSCQSSLPNVALSSCCFLYSLLLSPANLYLQFVSDKRFQFPNQSRSVSDFSECLFTYPRTNQVKVNLVLVVQNF